MDLSRQYAPSTAPSDGKDSVASYVDLEIIEAYPQDKYLPSFLVRGEDADFIFHAQIATDVEGRNVRVVTMYIPNDEEWDNNGRIKRCVR